jgi:hypothetical protein
VLVVHWPRARGALLHSVDTTHVTGLPQVGDHGMGMYIDALSNAWANHPSRLSAVDALKARVTQMANKLSETLSANLPTHLSTHLSGKAQ